MLIKQLLTIQLGQKSEDIEVRSVNGFQGREKDVIIFSSVVSNKKGKIGFMWDPKRLNVTMTRARYCFIMVGDVECLADACEMWQRVQCWYQRNGLLHNTSDFTEPYENAHPNARIANELALVLASAPKAPDSEMDTESEYE